MRIASLSTGDTKGGAALAAYRLHRGLRALEQDATLFVAERYSNDPSVRQTTSLPFRRLFRRLFYYRQLSPRFWRYWLQRPAGYGAFTGYRRRRARRLPELLNRFDVVQLHWIAHFVDLPAFLKSGLPLVWTLHDMNGFTGGCHYSAGCRRYLDGCFACPQLGSNVAEDASFRIWRGKRDLYSRYGSSTLHLVCPSRWLAGEVAASRSMAHLPVTVIANGLDTKTFAPHDPVAARLALGVPPNVKIVLFSAESVTDPRKGLLFLLEAMRGLSQENVLLLSLGKGVPANTPREGFRSLGRVAGERQLALAYSAADVFVVPSLEDNLPNTVLEALSCGTPVIGSNVGGIPEAVRPGETGTLVPPADAAALAAAVDQLLGSPDHVAALGENARRLALQSYDHVVQAERYLELYAEIVKQRITK